MKYDIEIKLAQENAVIEKSQIFDYRDTKYDFLFDDYYNFCREHLDNNIKKYNIEPTIFIFTSSLIPNARAQYYKDSFSIHINLGLFKICTEKFLTNSSLDEYFEVEYPKFINYYDNPVSVLAFQIATQFTYYHEFAHLIQLSKKRENLAFQERYSKDSKYNKTRQLLETNADTIASIAIASHIEQYIKKSYSDEISQEYAEFTITIFCCFLLHHIINFCDILPKIYFNEHEHPHPFVRLFIINLNIVNILNKSEFFKDHDIALPINEIFASILHNYQILERNNIFNTELKEVIKEASENQQKIVQYMFELIKFNSDEYYNAVDEWNKHIS